MSKFEIDYEELIGTSIDHEDVLSLYENMTPEEQYEFDRLLATGSQVALMPHQIVPVEQEWWEMFLLIGGRGTGKTVTGANAAIEHLRAFGKDARVGIGAPTNADARDTCMEGQTGLMSLFGNEFGDTYNRSLGEARHQNGGFVKAMGTEQEKKWNGPQWSFLWFDELALCNQKAWDDANMGLRLTQRPYSVGTTTPKNKKWVRKLAEQPTTYVPQYLNEQGKRRLPTTFDNPYLPQRRVQFLKEKYGGTRLGKQELEGVFIEDVMGAMWSRGIIRHETDSSKWPKFKRIVVAIDPAGQTARKTADENSLTEEQRQNRHKNADTAIAVVALGRDNKFYLLAVQSGQWVPSEWGKKALEMYVRFKADRIIAEQNFGGLMVENTIRTIKYIDPSTRRSISGTFVPIKLVTASRGKHIRAEPVVALYEQGRVIHCAQFGAAEDQMCAFVDAEDNEGADMVDAVVWGVTELSGGQIHTTSNIIIVPGDPRMDRFIHV